MTNNTSLNVGPASSWQLRAEYWVTASPDGDRQLADQVTGTMRELDLQPLQLEQIQKAVLEAVQRASLCGKTAEAGSPVHMRIWVAGECASDRSWGFFLVVKPSCVPQGALVQKERLVELFLYQERNS